MSQTQVAFIEKARVPVGPAWEDAVRALGFDFAIDKTYQPFNDEGFLPCRLNEKFAGFELFFEAAEDVLADFPHLKPVVGNRDVALRFVWGGDLRECASVLLAIAALLRDYDAVIHYQDDDMLMTSVEELLADARLALQNIPPGISTQNLTPLPPPQQLRRAFQSLAMLDAIMCAEWENRYYSFDAHWNPSLQVGSMRNGEGDEFVSIFDYEGGGIIKGFAHESEMTPFRLEEPAVWPGVLDSLPEPYWEILDQSAFSPDEVTFCIWRTPTDTTWQRGRIVFPDNDFKDGSEDLLSILDGRPETCHAWAQEYYCDDSERTLSLEAVRAVYEHRPLDAALLALFDCDRPLAELIEEAEEIGYPYVALPEEERPAHKPMPPALAPASSPRPWWKFW